MVANQRQEEIHADIDFIGNAVKRMVLEIQQAIAIEELLEAGAGPKEHALTKKLQARFNNTEVVPTISLLQLIMRRDITLCMTRLHDGPQSGRMSFGEVFRKIQKPATRSAFIQRQSERAKYLYNREAEEWLSGIIAQWSKGIEQDFIEHLTMLRAARNVYLAHGLNEEPKLPTYTQLFDFVSFTAELVGELGCFTGVYLNGFNETRNIKRELAMAFWSALILSNWKSRRDLLQGIEDAET